MQAKEKGEWDGTDTVGGWILVMIFGELVLK